MKTWARRSKRSKPWAPAGMCCNCRPHAASLFCTCTAWRPRTRCGSSAPKREFSMVKPGQLYGVSLGPGDPGLITRRAWALLERADVVWTYPVRSLRKESYALDIALRAGLALPEKHQSLLFPMTHDVEKLARHWLKAAETVRDLLATGQDVLFL